MAENIKNEKGISRYPLPIIGGDIVKLQLNTPKNARNSYSRVMRLYTAGKVDHATFRNLVYAFSVLINLLRLEKDIEVEKRIEAIEKQIREQAQKIG